MDRSTPSLTALKAENEKLRREQAAYDSLLDRTEAVLHSIEAGDLLAALPSVEHDANRHNTACHLLDMLHDEVRQCRQKVEA